MEALILLAGQGERISTISSGNPKCFLKIDNKTILDIQLNNLINSGISKIVLVVGFKEKIIINYILNKYNNLNVEFVFVHNKSFKTTNTLYSFAKGIMKLNEEFIFLNGDVVFKKEIIDNLRQNKNNCIVVSKHKLGNEEMKTIVNSNKEVLKIDKNLDPKSAFGEFIGIGKFSSDFLKFKQTIFEIASKNKKEYFEFSINKLLKKTNLKIETITKTESDCLEIDFPTDLIIANKKFKNMNENEIN